MPAISTKNLSAIPEILTLKNLCKSLAALDAVICPDWDLRYHLYDKNWSPTGDEECYHMRSGSGDELYILFNRHGAIINGFAHESEMNLWVESEVPPVGFRDRVLHFFGKRTTNLQPQIWKGVVDRVPTVFAEFIFEEPIKSAGTTFCIWRESQDKQWKIGDIEFPGDSYGDGSKDLLRFLDAKPNSYVRWAKEYYEEQFDGKGPDPKIVQHVYESKPLNKDLVMKLNSQLHDLNVLRADLEEIGYPYVE